jgi:dihydrofolate reductase
MLGVPYFLSLFLRYHTTFRTRSKLCFKVENIRWASYPTNVLIKLYGSADMGKVVTGISMSLDGFVTGPNDGPERPLGDGGEWLFKWYFSGITEVKMPGAPVFKVSPVSAQLIEESVKSTGAMVAGRRMFDIAKAWGGTPPIAPCFVVTHTPSQAWVKDGSAFTFVTDGVESAIRQAKQAAGDKHVAVATASITQQCLKAGLLDEIHIDLAPVLLGSGVRLFDYLGIEPIELESTQVVQAPGVTHLTFRVVK